MPKLKTKSGAKKRFSVTATGKVRTQSANNRHRRVSKPMQAKRKLRGTTVLPACEARIVLKNWLRNA